jgi:predicted ATPase/DNA-binding SARP family transcriptional activator
MTPAALEFRLLGPVEVSAAGRPLDLGGSKQRSVLALLLLRANELVPAERLIDHLWGESAPATAANTLQVHVSQLRKALGAPEALETQAGGYVLRVAADHLDLDRFERLVGEARREESAERRAAKLRQAGALWRGEPLADLRDEPWAQAEIRRLEELRLVALEDRLDADLASGRAAELVAELETLVAQHPLRERLRGQLMLALYRAGRQAEALEEYQRARGTFVDELGIDPSPELQRLEKAILTQDASVAAPAAHRPRVELPTPPTPLVGREREVEDACALLRREDVRLVTLTGPGGIGKTRLALEIARRFADEEEEVVFVGLAAIGDVASVAPTMAKALGVSEAGAAVEDSLEQALRQHAPLVVLDNLEQLLDAGTLLARLLAAAPRLKLLVTSRAVLHLSGEHEYPVPPLGAEHAVALFVQRAQAARRAFEPDAAERREVRELCAGLDGIPLAIELAAARAKLLTPAQMLERLGQRLELLAPGPRDLPARQQTLRATADWSYELLDDHERALFAQLGAFVGGCTLEAAEAVCGDGAVLDALGSLVDKSLIRLVESDGISRFWMLRTMREYALEKLAAGGDEAEVRRRHLHHYLALAQAAEGELNGPGLEEWSNRLEHEHGNLRGAIDFALSEGEGETALRICAGLRRFWEFHGHLAEGRRVSVAAIEAAPDADSALRAKVWSAAGILAGEQGDFEASQRFLEAALDEARASRDEERVGSALTNIGNLALYRGDYEQAQSLYEEAIAVSARIGFSHAETIARENLGLVMLGLGDLDAAVRIFEETIAVARGSGATHDLSTRLSSLARVLIERGETERPREALAEALELAGRLKEPRGLADCLEATGGLATAMGDHRRAAALFGAADALRASIGGMRPPDQQPWFEPKAEAARAALGDGEFEAQWQRGGAADPDQALELAEAVARASSAAR